MGVVGALSLGAAGCASTSTAAGSNGDGPGRQIQSVHAPLDASVAASSGTWIDVAMGHTNDRANTFWQLVVEPAGASRWAVVTPPGYADNGGVMSAQAGSTFVAGFGASALIGFSPLSGTTSAGAKWEQGVVDRPLTPVPDALAGSSSGDLGALVGSSDTTVLSSTGDLSQWHTAVTQKVLAASRPGRSCDVTALTAVSFGPGGGLLVGATCTKPGTVGVFARSTDGWSLAGPSLPASEANAAATVLRLRGWLGGDSALVEARSPARTVLLGSSSGTGSGATWLTPVALPLASTAQVVSSGVSATGALVVLIGDGGRRTADVLQVGAASWAPLPVPPSGTAAVALAPGGETDAVTVKGNQLHVFHLEVGQADWHMVQTIKVPIQYGSSS